MVLSSSSFAEIGVPINWRRVSQGISVLPKGSQATCRVWWGTGNCSGANSVDLGLIYNWFGLPWDISQSCSDISVLLDLWGISGGLSVLPSSKSRLLTCLTGNKELLYTQCMCIEPHLSASEKSDGFSRVAAGSWGMFSSYGGGRH